VVPQSWSKWGANCCKRHLDRFSRFCKAH